MIELRNDVILHQPRWWTNGGDEVVRMSGAPTSQKELLAQQVVVVLHCKALALSMEMFLG